MLIIFSFLKKQMHIFNMSAITMQSFRLIAQIMWEEWIIQTCHPGQAQTNKF